MAKTSILHLYSEVPLDKNYKNICDNVSLSTLSSYLMGTLTDLTFIRFSGNQGSIDVKYAYETLLSANYIAFQNPNYSTRTFYAFVDSIEYISDWNHRINFTIDVLSTYWNDWSASPCFVLREHEQVQFDTIGHNTLPEPVGAINYTEPTLDVSINLEPNKGMLLVTQPPEGSDSWNMDIYPNVLFPRDNQPYYLFKNLNLNHVEPDPEHPNWVYSLYGLIDKYILEGNERFILGAFGYNTVADSGSVINHFPVTMPTTIDGYTPRNKKLLQYPYNMLHAQFPTSDTIYKYELFDFNHDPALEAYSQLTPIQNMAIFPMWYAGKPFNVGEAIAFNPTVQYQFLGDSMAMWNESQGRTEMINALIATINNGFSFAIGNYGGAAVGELTTILNTANSYAQAQRIPNQLHGDASALSLLATHGEMKYRLYQRCVTKEYAIMIDNYFDRYGYAINRVKVPEMYTRPTWNYVQVADDIANNPTCNADAIEIINNVFRGGTTIWHSLANVGDFSLNNR